MILKVIKKLDFIILIIMAILFLIGDIALYSAGVGAGRS